VHAFEARIAHLEGAYDQISDRLNSIDRRLDGLETKVDAKIGGLDSKIDARFGELDAKIDGLDVKFDAKIDRLQWRMTTLIVGTWITTMLTVLFHR